MHLLNRSGLRLAGIVTVSLAILGGLTLMLYRQRQPAAHFAAGWQALQANDLQSLRTHAAALKDVVGFEPQAHLLKGALLLRTGLFAESVGEFTEAANDPAVRRDALTLGGEALYKLGRFGDAEMILEKAIALDPVNVEAQRWLAAAYYDTGAVFNAIEHLKKVAELAPRDGRPHRLMGLIRKDGEQFKLAIADYRESLSRDPHPADEEQIRVELAESLLRDLQHAAARDAVATCNDSPPVLTIRAQCQLKDGQPEAARALLEQALKADSDFLPALLLGGTLWLDAGQADRAAQILKHAAARHPHDFTVRQKLAQAYHRLGKKELAEQEVARAEAEKKLRREFTDLHEQAATNPRDAALRFRLGQTASALDEPELARMWFRAALALDPKFDTARQALNELSPIPAPGG